tara:strand:+ start:542 stop:760 length:219 start_codon:yes stop_codon:yes gene_type:complete
MENTNESLERIRLAIWRLRSELETIQGTYESCEYYMNLAERRGVVIDMLRKEIDRLRTARCTYMMTQEDLND